MKTRKRIRLRAKFLKSNYFKAEAPKINQSAINRELDKLFFESRIKNLLSNQLQGNVSLRKSLIISKNTSIPKLLLNQLQGNSKFRVILDLKLSGNKKGHIRFLVTI